MMRNRWIVAAVLMAVLPVLACSFSVDMDGDTPEPEGTAPPPQLPAETPTVLPLPTLVIPTPEGPVFTDLFFSAGVTDGGDPTDVATSFPAGTTIVYSFASYVGMSDGAQIDSVWYLDDAELVRTPGAWDMGESGESAIAYVEAEGGAGLDPGRYSWELYVDEGLVMTGSFAVGAGPAALFEDDFSDPNSGWETGSFEHGEARYEGGELHILNYTASEFITISRPGLHFTDLVMEVESRLVGGSDDNWHHHICRRIDADNYYIFGFSADGYYNGSVYVDDEQSDFVSPTRSDVIRQGMGVTNVARLECNGNRLRFWVNDTLLVDVTDTNLTEGDIALAAGSLGGEHSEVAFDNLVVYAP